MLRLVILLHGTIWIAVPSLPCMHAQAVKHLILSIIVITTEIARSRNLSDSLTQQIYQKLAKKNVWFESFGKVTNTTSTLTVPNADQYRVQVKVINRHMQFWCRCRLHIHWLLLLRWMGGWDDCPICQHHAVVNCLLLEVGFTTLNCSHIILVCRVGYLLWGCSDLQWYLNDGLGSLSVLHTVI